MKKLPQKFKILFLICLVLIELSCIKKNTTEPEQGEKWLAVNNGLTDLHVQAITVDPQNPEALYAGTFQGVFKTTDGAQNWQKLDGATYGDVRTIVVDPLNSKVIYVGTFGGGIFKSSDAGETWKSVSAGFTDPRIYKISIQISNPDVLYAATVTGLYKSTDAAESWLVCGGDVRYGSVTAVEINLDAPDTVFAGTGGWGIFKSIDGGQYFQRKNEGVDAASDGSYFATSCLAKQGGGEGRFFAGTARGLYLSTNMGETWTRDQDQLNSGAIRSVVIDSNQPASVFVGVQKSVTGFEPEGAFMSVDSGQSWQEINEGLTEKNVRAAVIARPGIVYVGTWGGGVFKRSW